MVIADCNTTPSSGCYFHATSGFVHDLVELLLLLLLLLTLLFFSVVKLQLVVHTVLLVPFLTYHLTTFSGQFCFLWGFGVDA
jgi:hypothetical protein